MSKVLKRNVLKLGQKMFWMERSKFHWKMRKERNEDEVSGKGNVCYFKVPSIDESLVHRNVDTLQEVCNETSDDEGGVINVQ